MEYNERHLPPFLFVDIESNPLSKSDYPFSPEAKRQHQVVSYQWGLYDPSAGTFSGSQWRHANPSRYFKGGRSAASEEYNLLRKFGGLLKSQPSAAVVGWNSEEYDFFVLSERGKSIGLSERIGKRNQVDMMQLARKAFQETKGLSAARPFSLDAFAQDLGITGGKVELPEGYTGENIHKLLATTKGRRLLRQYALKDVDLLAQIESKTNLVAHHLSGGKVPLLTDNFRKMRTYAPALQTEQQFASDVNAGARVMVSSESTQGKSTFSRWLKEGKANFKPGDISWVAYPNPKGVPVDPHTGRIPKAVMKELGLSKEVTGLVGAGINWRGKQHYFDFRSQGDRIAWRELREEIAVAIKDDSVLKELKEEDKIRAAEAIKARRKAAIEEQSARKTLQTITDKPPGIVENVKPSSLDDYADQALKNVKQVEKLSFLRRATPYAIGIGIGADVLASRDKQGPFWGLAGAGAGYTLGKFLTRNKSGLSRFAGLAAGYGIARMIGSSLSISHNGPLPGFGHGGEAPVSRQQLTDFGSGKLHGQVTSSILNEFLAASGLDLGKDLSRTDLLNAIEVGAKKGAGVPVLHTRKQVKRHLPRSTLRKLGLHKKQGFAGFAGFSYFDPIDIKQSFVYVDPGANKSTLVHESAETLVQKKNAENFKVSHFSDPRKGFSVPHYTDAGTGHAGIEVLKAEGGFLALESPTRFTTFAKKTARMEMGAIVPAVAKRVAAASTSQQLEHMFSEIKSLTSMPKYMEDQAKLAGLTEKEAVRIGNQYRATIKKGLMDVKSQGILEGKKFDIFQRAFPENLLDLRDVVAQSAAGKVPKRHNVMTTTPSISRPKVVPKPSETSSSFERVRKEIIKSPPPPSSPMKIGTVDEWRQRNTELAEIKRELAAKNDPGKLLVKGTSKKTVARKTPQPSLASELDRIKRQVASPVRVQKKIALESDLKKTLTPINTTPREEFFVRQFKPEEISSIPVPTRPMSAAEQINDIRKSLGIGDNLVDQVTNAGKGLEKRFSKFGTMGKVIAGGVLIATAAIGISKLTRSASAHENSDSRGSMYRSHHPSDLEGFRHEGIAAGMRMAQTPFGSGIDPIRNLARVLNITGNRADRLKKIVQHPEVKDAMIKAFQEGEGAAVGKGGIGEVRQFTMNVRNTEVKFAAKTYDDANLALKLKEREGLEALQETVGPTPYFEGSVLNNAGKQERVLFMEYIDQAQTLKEWSKEHGKVTPTMKKALSEGLDQIHKKDMFHGDLTPNNVMVDANQNLFIIDPMPGRHFGSIEAGVVNQTEALQLGKIQDQMAMKTMISEDVTTKAVREKIFGQTSGASGAAFQTPGVEDAPQMYEGAAEVWHQMGSKFSPYARVIEDNMLQARLNMEQIAREAQERAVQRSKNTRADGIAAKQTVAQGVAKRQRLHEHSVASMTKNNISPGKRHSNMSQQNALDIHTSLNTIVTDIQRYVR